MAARENSAGGPPAGAADDEIDALFQLPLPDFTAARNLLVATWKKSGRHDDAAALKAVPRPPISAWAVNQLHWRYRGDMAALQAAGDRFREAQRAQLAGTHGDLRATLEAWREALGAMTTRAGAVLREAGHRPTPELMRRVSTTLEVLATRGAAPDAPAAGRLAWDLDPLGFDVLTALVPRGGSSLRGSTPTRVIPFTDTKRATAAGEASVGASGAARGGASGRASAKGKSMDPHGTSRRGRSERRVDQKADREADREAERRAEFAKQQAAARIALEAAEKTLGQARRAAIQAEVALKEVAGVAKAAEQKRAAAEKRLTQATSESEEAVRESETATREAHRVARAAEEAAQALSDAEGEVERARAAIRT